MSDFSAFIIAAAIVLSALSKLIYHVRPRRMFSQVTVSGITDQDGEQMHCVVTLFEDESKEIWNKKISDACQLKADRLTELNEKMLAIHAEAKRQHETKQSVKAVKS